MTLPLPSTATVETYPNDERWLAGRQAVPHQLGGSDIAAILNRCPPSWGRGPWTLYSRAQGLETRGFSAAQQADLDRGNRWERFITRAEYAEPRGYRLLLGGQRCIIRSSEHPWASFSPDDIAETPDGPVLVETKTARHGRHLFGEDGDIVADLETTERDALPVYYLLQVLWGLHLTGLSRAHVLAAIPQSSDWPEVRVITVEAQPEQQAAIFAEVARRRDLYMVQGIAPDADGTDDCSLALAQLYPDAPEKTYKPATGEIHDAAIELGQVKADIKRLDQRRRTLNNTIQQHIADDYGLTVDTGADKLAKVIAVRSGGRRSVSLSALEQHPDLYAALDERGLITTGSPSVSIRTYGL